MDIEQIKEVCEKYFPLREQVHNGIGFLSLYDIIDENQTVSWNRQQIEIENRKRKREYSRKKKEVSSLEDTLKNYCVQYISEKTGLQSKISENLFNYLTDEGALIPAYNTLNSIDLFLFSLEDLISCFII